MFEALLATGIALGLMMSTFLLMNCEEIFPENIDLLLGESNGLSSRYNTFVQDEIDEKSKSWEKNYSQVFSDQESSRKEKIDLMGMNVKKKLIKGGITKEEKSFNSKKKGGDNVVDLFQTEIELLKLPVLIGENDVQKMLVSDLELDFTAQKVRNIDASIQGLSYEVITNKVIIQGVAHKQIFYVTEDNVVQHQAEDVPFSLFVDLPGAQPGMEVDITPVIEDIKVELLAGGTVLHQKVILAIDVLVEEIQQLFVERGDEPLALVDRVIGENENQTMIESTIDLDIPAIKVTNIVARLQDITTEVIDNKVIIQGVLHKQIFFIGEDNVEYHQEENVSFSHFVDLPGAEPGMDVQVHPEIEHIKKELINDGATLSQEVVVSFFVKVTESVQIGLATGDTSVRLREVIGENTKQILKESDIGLDIPAIKIKDIDASITNIETQVVTNKIIVQGNIHKQIYFIGEDNVEYHQEENVPFSTFLDLPGVSPTNTDVVVDSQIEFIKPILDEAGEVLTQKVVLELFVKAIQDPPVLRQITVASVPPYGG
jgi:hypothetical protein